jgi:protocatechuate 3,4-dioxygenase beta subunit
MISTIAVIWILLSTSLTAGNEPVIGGPCEGCELVFSGMPSTLSSQARIAPKKENGERLVIEGTVRDAEGRAAPGIIVYAYQTDAAGVYPRGTTRHGRLRAWVISDSAGRYRFDTIRPGSYPRSRNPQHVHMHVIEPGKATYYISDLLFEDDPLLASSPRQRRPRGGDGVARPVKDAEGIWHVRRDIVLRLHVPE